MRSADTFPAVSIVAAAALAPAPLSHPTARDIKTEFAASTAHHLGPAERHSHIQISSTLVFATLMMVLGAARVLNENESSFEIITLKRRRSSLAEC